MTEVDDKLNNIDGKVILGIAYRYKYLIISITLIMMIIAAVFAYLRPDIYRSSTKIQLINDKAAQQSMITMTFDGGVENKEDEISLIKSRLMVDKTLEKLDLGTRYFYKNRLKTHELYKMSPFVVKVLSMERPMHNKKIYIEPIDEDHFRLHLKDPGLSLKKIKKLLLSKLPPSIQFSQEYVYGEKVTTKWFNIQVEKISKIMRKEYYFTYRPNKAMGKLITSGLSAGFSSRNSSILEISYEDTVPLRASEVVNAITQTYLEDEVAEKLKTTDQTLDYLDNQLATLTKILNKSATKLRTFKQSNTDVTITGVTEATAGSMTGVQTQLKELDFEESVLSNLKTYIDSGNDLTALTLSASDYSNQSLVDKIEQFQLLNEKHREVLTVYTEFHPEVIKAVDDINRMKKNIKYLVDSNLKNVQRKKQTLIRDLDKLKESLVHLPQKERQLASLTRNFAVNEKIYSFLLEKRTEVEILHSSKTANVRVLNKASVPGWAIKPNRKFIVIIGAVLGALFGFFIAFILHTRDDTIKSLEEVTDLSKISIFGLVPQITKGKRTVAFDEAYRTLRTNLEFIDIKENSKIILVASAISGEGKSSTVVNLAEMLVKLDRKVIVLDFDLRRPSLHKYFKGISNTLGLSVLLSGQNNLDECLEKTLSGIHVLSAGPIPPNPSELIASDACNLLFKALSNNYDYILIDSPPYSIVTDAVLLMKKADITLFSLMNEYTKRNHVRDIEGLIKKYSLSASGLVYSGIKLKKKEQHGYGYFENS